MLIAPPADNESGRIEALLNHQILDTSPEQGYDDITAIAAEICQTPISLVSLVDTDRQWFKSRVGLDATETPRDLAFCAHAILQEGLLIVEDTLEDERFSDNPLVTEDPKIRFYAGAPLVTHDGYALGTLCVIDREPRTMTQGQKETLAALARQVVSQLELRMHAIKLQKANKLRDHILSMLSNNLMSAFNSINGFGHILSQRLDKLTGEQIREIARDIEGAGENAHQELRNIIEWTQQKDNEKITKKQWLDVNSACEQVIQILSKQAHNKNVTIQLHCPDALGIHTNPSILHSVLLHLIGNAVKFSYEDKPVIVNVVKQGDQVSVSVVDQGVGMSQETLSKLFKSQEAFCSKGTSGETGAGVGHLLVKDFVSSLGGNIVATSIEGEGSEVGFTLPCS
ncbi:MAG: GAF domain-containing sensor histidine kinase [Pseudomonadales bacterium]|nr:GAF domain-containing sensor histidine kinase [Pseudomonadales bacterium]